MLCQRSAEGTEGGDCAFGRARDVCVIQKCIQVLTRAEGGTGRLQCAVDADREQSGHQRVTLFATFRLGYGVGLARFVIKEVLTLPAIEHADKRDEGRQSWAIAETLEHTTAGDVIVGSDPIHANHYCRLMGLRSETERARLTVLARDV